MRHNLEHRVRRPQPNPHNRRRIPPKFLHRHLAHIILAAVICRCSCAHHGRDDPQGRVGVVRSSSPANSTSSRAFAVRVARRAAAPSPAPWVAVASAGGAPSEYVCGGGGGGGGGGARTRGCARRERTPRLLGLARGARAERKVLRACCTCAAPASAPQALWAAQCGAGVRNRAAVCVGNRVVTAE